MAQKLKLETAASKLTLWSRADTQADQIMLVVSEGQHHQSITLNAAQTLELVNALQLELDITPTTPLISTSQPTGSQLVRILERFNWADDKSDCPEQSAMRGQLYRLTDAHAGWQGIHFAVNKKTMRAEKDEYEVIDPADTSKVQNGDRVRITEKASHVPSNANGKVFTVVQLSRSAPDLCPTGVYVDANWENHMDTYVFAHEFTLVPSDTPLG